jgi:hypothetical protein
MIDANSVICAIIIFEEKEPILVIPYLFQHVPVCSQFVVPNWWDNHPI